MTGLCGLLSAVMLTACGGSNAVNVSVGGTVNGLDAGATITLENNGSNPTVITGTGSPVNFVFSNKVASQTPYDVTVSAQPTTVSQSCVLSNGAGEIDFAGDAISNVVVDCYANIPVNVTVTGLASGNSLTVQLMLQNNPQNVTSMVINANTASGSVDTFPNPLPINTVYSVIVMAQPTTPPQTCTIAQGTGSGGVVQLQPPQNIVVPITCI